MKKYVWILQNGVIVKMPYWEYITQRVIEDRIRRRKKQRKK